MGQVGSRRRRRRWPFVVAGLAVIVIVGLIVTNFVTRAVAEQTLANRIKKATGAGSVSASINSSPFLYDVLVPGKIQGVHVVARSVPVGQLNLEQVTVDTSQVALDRHQLIADQQVHIVSIASATVTAVFKPEGLSSVLASGADLLGLHVTLSGGHELVVDLLDRQVYRVDLASNPLLSGCDFSLQATGGTYSLSCHVAPVPQSMLSAISEHQS